MQNKVQKEITEALFCDFIVNIAISQNCLQHISRIIDNTNIDKNKDKLDSERSEQMNKLIFDHYLYLGVLKRASESALHCINRYLDITNDNYINIISDDGINENVAKYELNKIFSDSEKIYDCLKDQISKLQYKLIGNDAWK